jgi:hypothetical protein
MRHSERRYGVVLLLVLSSVVLQLALSGSNGARFAIVTLQALTLVAAVLASGATHRRARVSAGVAVVVVAASAVGWVIRGDVPPGPAAVVNGLLVAVAPVVIARGLLAELRGNRTVTIHTLSGVLSIYLLAGMFFGFVYGAIAVIDPDAMFAGHHGATAAETLYFSFVTLCTVGYGDFAPLAEFSRAVAVGEMLIGQIYLVTIVSLIVANLVPAARARRDEASG